MSDLLIEVERSIVQTMLCLFCLFVYSRQYKTDNWEYSKKYYYKQTTYTKYNTKSAQRSTRLFYGNCPTRTKTANTDWFVAVVGVLA
jgi:hypothetical protein